MSDIKRIVETLLPTKFGDFNMIAFDENEENNFPHIAMVHKDVDGNQAVMVRIHSECITGDLFGSKKCDCGEQLDLSMSILGENKGVLIYLRQEGRGIGLINKMKAYKLQEGGMDTIDSNLHLGFKAEERDFTDAIQILKLLGISEIQLLTNNPIKIEAFEDSEVKVQARVPLIINANEVNSDYLETKKKKMGHLL